MAESPATLLRSFSHPSDASREVKEGDPIARALTESISFGRFVSESLAWERWSTFSHNRYLEEVEKFSKPGSVAEKKAYFESHYKRKAAMKAAALLEEASAVTNDVPDLETASDVNNNSPVDRNLVKEKSPPVGNEEKEQDMPNTEPTIGNRNIIVDEKLEEHISDTHEAHSAEEANISNPTNRNNDLQNAVEERCEPTMEYAVNLEGPDGADKSKQLHADASDKITASPVQESHVKEIIKQKDLASSGKREQSRCPPKSSAQEAPKPPKEATSLPSRKANKVAMNKKSVGDITGKRRVIPKSLHMSINFNSSASETRKSSVKVPKVSSTSAQSPTQAAVTRVSKIFSKFVQSEDKRSKEKVNTPVSAGVTEDKKLQLQPPDHTRPSSANGKAPSSPFRFRSEERVAKRKEFFRKLEEKRNAKETEKAQLETRSKEKADNGVKRLRQSQVFKARQSGDSSPKPHIPSTRMKKEKEEPQVQKLRHSSISFNTKTNEDLSHGSTSTSNHVTKTTLTQPCSPKLGRKPSSTALPRSSTRPPSRPTTNLNNSKHVVEKHNGTTTASATSVAKNTNTRPPWGSSVNKSTSKLITDKSKRSTTASVTSLPKKNSHENTSPNIQR